MARAALYNWLRESWNKLRWVALPALGHEIVRHRSPNQILSRWPEGEIPLGPRVCVFVHWDGAGEVRDHVLHQVRALSASGFSVVFVTNSGRLRPDSLEAVKPSCAAVIVRANVGYDFGAWREGIEQCRLPRPDTTMVAIANDSVYGPLRALKEMIDAIDFNVADIWGCTESYQGRYHLQSYFMAFSPAVVAGENWKRFWGGVRPTWAKIWLIKLYEIGLTQSMLRAGYRCRAIWPYKTLIADVDVSLLRAREGDAEGPDMSDPLNQARQRHVFRLRDAMANRWPLNPTSDLWRQLLRARFPFLKRELLRSNPSFVQDVVEWREVLGEVSEASLAPVEKDLQRTLRNRAP